MTLKRKLKRYRMTIALGTAVLVPFLFGIALGVVGIASDQVTDGLAIAAVAVVSAWIVATSGYELYAGWKRRGGRTP